LRALPVLMAGMFLIVLDCFIVNVTIPAMQVSLMPSAGPCNTHWWPTRPEQPAVAVRMNWDRVYRAGRGRAGDDRLADLVDWRRRGGDAYRLGSVQA